MFEHLIFFYLCRLFCVIHHWKGLQLCPNMWKSWSKFHQLLICYNQQIYYWPLKLYIHWHKCHLMEPIINHLTYPLSCQSIKFDFPVHCYFFVNLHCYFRKLWHAHHYACAFCCYVNLKTCKHMRRTFYIILWLIWNVSYRYIARFTLQWRQRNTKSPWSKFRQVGVFILGNDSHEQVLSTWKESIHFVLVL